MNTANSKLNEAPRASSGPGKLAWLLIVLAGIVLGQVVLYGPSLIGRKILLPLDVLTAPGVYIPVTPETERIYQKNLLMSDLVYLVEPARRFAVSELRAGRLPLWNPYQFAGAPAPFVWPRFSPFTLLECATVSPVVLAWGALLAAIVSGFGAYCFCRSSLRLTFWPGAVAGWCYPLTAFFVFWQGYTTALPVCWFPWILLAVDRTVRTTDWCRRGAASTCGAPVGLALTTCLVMISGQLDVAGQVLLASGLYAIWCLFFQGHGTGEHEITAAIQKAEIRNPRRCPPKSAFLRLAAGWALGLLLAAPAVLPVMEYTRTGARMARRSAGAEERPPIGWTALPQVVLPDLYGAMNGDSLRFAEYNQFESSAAAYASVIATLVLAPLAFCSRRHRRSNWFWIGLSLFSLSWCLGLPGFVQLLRLPGLNMMSHVRLVFMAGFAIVALAAIGLEVLLEGPVRWRGWFWIPATLLAALSIWCMYRMVAPPMEIDAQLDKAIAEGNQVGWVRDSASVQLVRGWFFQHFAAMAGWAGAGFFGWLILWSQPRWISKCVPAVAGLAVGELLWFGFGRNIQSDPTFYYPRVTVLEQVARSSSGRIIGAKCLPANLASTAGLKDIRGYDAVDPARLIDLLTNAAASDSVFPDYAATQFIGPRASLTPQGNVRLSPIMDMFAVQYVVGRESPISNTVPVFQSPDYWVLANPTALPRAYIPQRVETLTNSLERLRKLTAPSFDPREVAYVESPIDLPGPCRGQADIVEEIPTRVVISAKMQTPGLVVLADLWDRGWRVYLGGKPAPILRTNHAIRGVEVPAGELRLEFRYQPASFAWGLRLAALGGGLLACWSAAMTWQRNRKPRVSV